MALNVTRDVNPEKVQAIQIPERRDTKQIVQNLRNAARAAHPRRKARFAKQSA